MNFVADAPWPEDTTIYVHVPEGGISDVSGNAIMSPLSFPLRRVLNSDESIRLAAVGDDRCTSSPTVVSLGFSQEVFYAVGEPLVLWEGTEGSAEEGHDVSGAEPGLRIDASQVVATFDTPGVHRAYVSRVDPDVGRMQDEATVFVAYPPLTRPPRTASTVVDTGDTLYVAMTDHGVVARVQDSQVTYIDTCGVLPRWLTGPNS